MSQTALGTAPRQVCGRGAVVMGRQKLRVAVIPQLDRSSSVVR